MTDKEKTAKIFEILNDWVSRQGSVIAVPEFRFGTSWNGGCCQRQIDLFTISYVKGNESTSYEIKASRADFKKDVENEEKQRGARMFSDYFWYCAPKGMIKPDEVPVWAGLLEFDLSEEADIFHRVTTAISAPHLPRENPTWELIISALRRTDTAFREQIKKEIAKFNREFYANYRLREAYSQQIKKLPETPFF